MITVDDAIAADEVFRTLYSSIDKERFLLHMNDKNDVYINLSRMEYLNKYDDLSKELSNKKGILYLDSGNHFEIRN